MVMCAYSSEEKQVATAIVSKLNNTAVTEKCLQLHVSKLSSTPGNCGEVHDNQHFITYSLTSSCWKKQEASMGCGGSNQLCRNILAFVWGRGERSRPVTAMTGLSATLLTRQIAPCTTPISFPALQFLDQPSYRSLFHRPSKTFPRLLAHALYGTISLSISLPAKPMTPAGELYRSSGLVPAISSISSLLRYQYHHQYLASRQLESH